MTYLQLDSRKHGIDPAQLAIHQEEIPEFNELLAGLYQDMRPNGELQRILFGQILHAFWNMRIARQHQAQALLKAGPLHSDIPALSKFLIANERAFYRAITELRSLQTELAYRATLASNEDSPLPDVPPLVRTAEVHKQVRITARFTALPKHPPAPTEPRPHAACEAPHYNIPDNRAATEGSANGSAGHQK